MKNLFFVDGDSIYNYGEHEYINCLSSICAICSKLGISSPYVKEVKNGNVVEFDIGRTDKHFVWCDMGELM